MRIFLPRAGSLSWAAMGTVVSSPAGALMATVVGSLGTACSDVVVDSIVVERSRNTLQVQPCRSTGRCLGARSEVIASLDIGDESASETGLGLPA